MSAGEFRNYYFLKDELVRFCRENGLATGGSKVELTGRVARFLGGSAIVEGDGDSVDSLSVEKARRRVANSGEVLSEESVIEEGLFALSDIERFSERRLGRGFGLWFPFRGG